tara:strand:+ start:2639 stop:2860 length:222 start_codon:yes stop_codon:yes gene_type:complete
MINNIKDWLGVRRYFSVSLYGVGYMGNAFHIKDVTILNSKKYIDKFGLQYIAWRHVDKRTVTYPRFFALITSD